MVKHVVCFKLKDNSPEACQKAKEVLMGMKGEVELLREISVGIDFLHSPRSYDLILETVFDSKEDLAAYQEHPYHVNVVKQYMHAVRTASISLDWEL